MSEQRYNGWKNWETWVVNLTYGEWIYEWLKEYITDNPSTDKYDAAELVKEYVWDFENELAGELKGLAGEFFSGGMRSVDWYDLVDGTYDDVMDDLNLGLKALKEEAEERVDFDDDVLEQYRDLLIDYEWDNLEDHYQWVIDADTDELVDWAETIRRQEAQQE